MDGSIVDVPDGIGTLKITRTPLDSWGLPILFGDVVKASSGKRYLRVYNSATPTLDFQEVGEPEHPISYHSLMAVHKDVGIESSPVRKFLGVASSGASLDKDDQELALQVLSRLTLGMEPCL